MDSPQPTTTNWLNTARIPAMVRCRSSATTKKCSAMPRLPAARCWSLVSQFRHIPRRFVSASRVLEAFAGAAPIESRRFRHDVDPQTEPRRLREPRVRRGFDVPTRITAHAADVEHLPSLDKLQNARDLAFDQWQVVLR